ncbi:hypothetical protein C7S18_13290 [Ahniella affigens]|uniref:Uncharacterized protein n=1 Tax=Ahniella affigens TaxID=2021234 RepID=A0A2P1PTF2_9GAMM|nr:hypothetical protein C7S18_13290 [Ahniella affigens]
MGYGVFDESPAAALVRLFAHQTVSDDARFLRRHSVASSPLPSPLPLAWERERYLIRERWGGPGERVTCDQNGYFVRIAKVAQPTRESVSDQIDDRMRAVGQVERF